MSNHLVVVRINANYRASVYDVEDLKRYIENHPKEVDYKLLQVEETPRHKVEKSIKTKDDYSEHLASVKAYINALFTEYLSRKRSILFDRNQAKRKAIFLFIKDGKFYFYYTMPNGAFYINKIDSIGEPDKYETVPLQDIVKKLTVAEKSILLDELQLHLEELQECNELLPHNYTWPIKGNISRTKQKIELLTI